MKITEEQRLQIIERHADNARRELEKLVSGNDTDERISQVSKRLDGLYISPTKNKAALKTAEKELEGLLQERGVAQQNAKTAKAQEKRNVQEQIAQKHAGLFERGKKLHLLPLAEQNSLSKELDAAWAEIDAGIIAAPEAVSEERHASSFSFGLKPSAYSED